MMDQRTFELLKLEFRVCSRLSLKVREGARGLLRILRSLGGVIRTVKIGPPHPDPEKEIDEQGNVIVPTGLEHELLEKDWQTLAFQARTDFPYRLEKNCKGIGSFGYVHEGQLFDLWQSGDETLHQNLDAVAKAQVAFGRLLYSHLRPKYGRIDEGGYDKPSDMAIARTELKYLFWANFFGPAFVEKYGKKFLLGAPGWVKEELDDGGILYVATESYFQWWSDPPREPFDYFRRQVPEIRLYRSAGGRFPFEVKRMVLTDEAGKQTVVYDRDRKKRKKKPK
jgi:hypothetical protein